MSVIFVFVVVWVLLVIVLVSIDYIANPNRGRFRPLGPRRARRRAEREADAERRRSLEDVAVRSVLRDRYGRSSLRLGWDDERETSALSEDDAILTGGASVHAHASPATAGEDDPAAADDDAEPSGATPHDDSAESDAAAPGRDETDHDGDDGTGGRRVWSVGDDPLAATQSGDAPEATTVRSRVWKNHAAVPVWDDANRERLADGRAPRRRNPLTGRIERASVDIERGAASWPGEAVDPFSEAVDPFSEAAS